MTITIATICERWNDPHARPLFKGSLIDDTGRCCAQGDVLRQAGWSDEELRSVDQDDADKAVAIKLGISVAHSVLLRHVNDSADGCPQDVLEAPEKILGDQAHRVLEFWRRLDAMSDDDWQKASAARAAAGDAARASNEIQGEAIMKKRGQAFFFLPMFGISEPAELSA